MTADPGHPFVVRSPGLRIVATLLGACFVVGGVLLGIARPQLGLLQCITFVVVGVFILYKAWQRRPDAPDVQ